MIEDFRTIDDFSVVLADTAGGGKHIEFVSVSQGRLAGFPAWEHADRDLRHFILSDIPSGTREEPYEDRDDDWRIAIFEHAGWVYIAEAHGPKTVAFRVAAGRYLAAWKSLIDRFHPSIAVDDLFDDSEVQ